MIPDINIGYMYTTDDKFQKAISFDKHIYKDINAELALSLKNIGLGINKSITKDLSMGAGVATKYDKFDPKVYASIFGKF